MILLTQPGRPVVLMDSHIVLGTGNVQRSHRKLVASLQVGEREKQGLEKILKS